MTTPKRTWADTLIARGYEKPVLLCTDCISERVQDLETDWGGQLWEIVIDGCVDCIAQEDEEEDE